METSYHGLLTGHTAVILKEIPVMIYDAPGSSKSQGNGPFHRMLWQGL